MAEKRMSFLEHLDELRSRLIISISAVLIGATVSFFFAFPILRWLKKPAGAIKLHYLSPMEPFMAKFKIAIYAGTFLAFPILLYEFLAFVSPALRKREKRYVYPLIFFLVVLFAMGVAVCYYFVLPMGIRWLLGQAGTEIVATVTVSQYVSFVGLFMLVFGLAFETPLVILLMVKLGIVSPQALRRQWRIAYVVILVIAAMATPDWSIPPMLILGGTMIFLYELSILLARIL